MDRHKIGQDESELIDPEQLELETLQKDVQRLQNLLHSEQSNW